MEINNTKIIREIEKRDIRVIFFFATDYTDDTDFLWLFLELMVINSRKGIIFAGGFRYTRARLHDDFFAINRVLATVPRIRLSCIF